MKGVAAAAQSVVDEALQAAESSKTVPADRPAPPAVMPPAEVHESHPLIDQIIASLDAKLLRVDEGFGKAKAPSTSADDEPNWSDPEEA
jgi:hypothetical protein